MPIIKRNKGMHLVLVSPWPTAVVVTNNEDAYLKFLSNNGITKTKNTAFPSMGAASLFTKEDGTSLVVIAVSPELEGMELIDTVVHEASHAVDFIFDAGGEASPGTETRAYLMGHIVSEALEALGYSG